MTQSGALLPGVLLEQQDQERRRIARELHDRSAQNLAALSMNLGLLERVIGKNPERAREILGECALLAGECVEEIRSLSSILHPPLLDELGLESALRAFIDGFQSRTGMAVTLEVPAPVKRLSPRIEVGGFRVIQESLLNAHRHSRSQIATVTLNRNGEELEVTIRDEGTGIAPGSSGLGIAAMRERIRALGGAFEIVPAAPGTLVKAVFPLNERCHVAAF